MAAFIEYPGDVNIRVNGTLSARTFVPPNGSISDAAISSAAGIAATKVIHQHAVTYAVEGTVAGATVARHIFRNAAEIVGVQVAPITAPTGGDLAYTVDVQVGDQSNAFASILGTVVTVDSSVADREVIVGGISSANQISDSILQVVVATSGSTGTQGSGLIVTVWIREEP